MIKPIQVEARRDFRVQFEDGVEGEVDLSKMIKRGGLFKQWEAPQLFRKCLDTRGQRNQMGDSDFHELYGDSLYRRITGIAFDEYSQRVKQNLIHA